MCHIDCIVGVDHHADKMQFLLFIGVEKLLKRSHFGDVLGTGTDLLALVHSLREDHLKRAAHIEECCVMPTVRAVRNLRFYATDDAVGTCLCKRGAAGHQCRNNDLVIVVSRYAVSFAGDGGGFDQQIMRCQIPNTDRQGRHWERHMNGCFHAHIGKVVGDILAVLVLTAHNQVLEQRIPGKALCRGCVTHLVEIIEFDPDAIQ